MQFVEKNSFNVRSAIYLLKNEKENIEFILFPMVHIGSKEFYNNISQRLSKCDLILAEGIKSKKADYLTLSYRIVKKVKRMNLVTQQDEMDYSKFHHKILASDLSKKDFDNNWSSIPFTVRVYFFVAIPFYVAYLFLFGTREFIAKNIAVEDLVSSDEILIQDDDLDKLDSVLLDARDKHLIEQIEHLLSSGEGKKKTVGILYGALHMRNISNYLLNQRNYQVINSEWVTIFDL